jgi:predicted phosphodiesterase
MRVAIISDSHGDLEALRAVLEDLGRRAPDAVVVAGDIAQGGPEPAAVVDALFELDHPIVRGNSDDFLVQLANGEPVEPGIPPATLERGRWTVEQLGPERIRRLAGLPFSFQMPAAANGPLVVVHATPWSNEEVVLADAPDEVAERMAAEARAGVLAYGHIHSPYQRRVADSVLLSVGAISGSNDVDPRPAYTVLDVGAEIVATVVRVEVARVKPAGAWPVRAPAGSQRWWP